MLTDTSSFKVITFFFLFSFLSTFQSIADPLNEVKESSKLSTNETTAVKNQTIGSWWMWASGSGLIVLIIFAFSKEDEGFSFK